MLCNGISENEIRELLIYKFGEKYNQKKVHKEAIFYEKIIFPIIMCYSQKCEFFELYNQQVVQYKFNCGSKFDIIFGDATSNIKLYLQII